MQVLRAIRPHLRFLPLSLCLSVVACGDDSGDESSHVLTVATYNAGLARSFVDYAVERAPAVADAVSAQDLDILCVQEVWEEEDWDTLTDAAAQEHTHRLAAMPEDADADAGAVGTCTQDELDPLEACVRSKCDVPPGELTSCALSMCGAEVGAISAECQSCITGVIGDVSIDEVVAVCGPGGEGGGSTWIWGGSFGIGLLSESPLSDKDALVLESTTTRRGVLSATIEGADGEPIHVFCTHLTANLAAVPYTGAAEDWEDENRDQVEAILAYIEDKAGDERALLLGDLNTGPKLDGVSAELEDNYLLLSDVLDNPYVAQDDARCSFCPDNPLQDADASDAVLIDHVMLGGWSDYDATGQRILDGELTIEVDGKDVDTALSDHYGVQLQITY